MHKKALTLIEIIISIIIVAITMAGMVNLFVSSKRWVLHSQSRMAGGELGKRFLEPLQMGVRQDQWGANCLSQNGDPAACDHTPWTDPYTGRIYTPTYNINPLGNLRRVIVTITWVE